MNETTWISLRIAEKSEYWWPGNCTYPIQLSPSDHHETSVLSAQAASPEGDMYKYRNLMVRSLCQQMPQAHLIFQRF